jgi:hypothetical protein
MDQIILSGQNLAIMYTTSLQPNLDGLVPALTTFVGMSNVSIYMQWNFIAGDCDELEHYTILMYVEFLPTPKFFLFFHLD